MFWCFCWYRCRLHIKRAALTQFSFHNFFALLYQSWDWVALMAWCCHWCCHRANWAAVWRGVWCYLLNLVTQISFYGYSSILNGICVHSFSTLFFNCAPIFVFLLIFFAWRYGTYFCKCFYCCAFFRFCYSCRLVGLFCKHSQSSHSSILFY